MSNRRRRRPGPRRRPRVGGWFTSESHADPDGECSCTLRQVELVGPASCSSCGELIDCPTVVPLPGDVGPGQLGPLGFACFCGADPVDLLVQVVA